MKQKRNWTAAAVCAVFGILLWAYLSWFQPDPEPYLAQGQVKRETYGGSTKEQKLIVTGLEEEEQMITVTVSPRIYTREEADAVFYEVMEGMEERIRGKNESLQAVSQDLKLPSYLSEYGVRVRWHSSEPELLSSAGSVDTEIKRVQEVMLQAELSAGDYRADFELPVTLVPEVLTPEEQQKKKFSEELVRLDGQQKYAEYLELPAEYQGKTLSYRNAEKPNYIMIPFLGVLMAALLLMQEESKQRELAKKREQQLLLDYAEVVSKLQVLVGAGMTVRNAWGRMVQDYEAVAGNRADRLMRKCARPITRWKTEQQRERRTGNLAEDAACSRT